ncbi:MAG: GIY-YIG nuclease family protein [Microcystis aeruginosa W13-15]|nr:GIY-YIG nuclease family protein [Microcystis aeruginosa W13-15]
MENYQFTKLPITPSIIEFLIIYLFNGQTLKRDDIVNKILDFHTANGGLKPEAQDFPRSVKKALARLQAKGHASNKSYGFWELHKSDSPEIKESEEETTEVIIDDIPTHEIYGEGKNAVYLYYFNNYKSFSLMKGESNWPCKIGRTDRDPLIRILSQSSTALPEKPTIEFIIKTEDSALLETMIHSILKVRNRYIQDSPGTEWFNTNPTEVLEIIHFVNNNILLKTK